MKQNKSIFYLSFITAITTLGGFLFGYDTAVISGTINFVTTKYHLDAIMEGWFVGSALLGCIIGVSVAGMISDKFGRKFTLLTSSVLFTVSAIGCALAIDHTQLIAYRMIGGLGIGIASMLAPLYISEISPPNIRGRLVSLYQFAITIGILSAYFVNSWLLNISSSHYNFTGVLNWIINDEVWRSMFGAGAIPALIFFGLLFFVPESPRWLTSKGKSTKAEAILTRVLGKEEAKKEIDDINETLKQETGSLKQLFQPGLRLALIIGMSLAILSQFTGINVIIYYGPKIMAQAGLSTADTLKSQVLIGLINCIFTIVALWKIDKLGRRPLLMIGIVGMSVCLMLIGLFFSINVSNNIWLLIFMLVYCAFFAFSFGPVIWTMLSEFYPTYIRGRAMSIATLTLWVGTYLMGQTFPWMLEVLKPALTFWIFALMCVPAFLITWKLAPETKGKTLEEIEKYWFSRKK
ncbi:MAG: sugar porter family MFS transporter [Bacteroidota bacterium]